MPDIEVIVNDNIIVEVSGGQGPAGSSASVTAANIASATHATTIKPSLTANDEFFIVDSEAANAGKRTLWSTILSTLTTAFNALFQPLDADLSSIAGLSPSNDDVIQRKSGSWINRTIAQLKADLSLSGSNTGDDATNALYSRKRIFADAAAAAVAVPDFTGQLYFITDTSITGTAYGISAGEWGGITTSQITASTGTIGGLDFDGDNLFAEGDFTAVGFVAGSNITSSGDTTGNSATSTTSSGLATTSTTVVVSGAAAPVSGAVLTASSSTAASWQTPATVSSIVGITGTLAQFNTAITDADILSTTSAASTYQPLDAALTALAAGSDFVQFTGPATSTKTFTLPNATCSILTDNAVVTGAQGGTGIANTGKTITLGASLTTTGTDLPTFAFPSAATARTYTFPTTTATLARTDASQTFGGNQTFTNKIFVDFNSGNGGIATSAGGLVFAAADGKTYFSSGLTVSCDAATGLELGSARGIAWANSSQSFNTKDTGLHRNAAGVVEINNGTAGTYRDLKCRNVELTGTTASTTTATGSLINAGGIGNAGVIYTQVPVNVQASSTTLNANKTFGIYSNEGASALVVLTLPSAAANLQYTFIVQDGDGIQVTAAAGDTIRIGSAVSAAAGNISNTVVGSTITLTAINATEWIATSSVGGTWTVT